MRLSLKSGSQKQRLIEKFNYRGQEKQIEQALVYLKLRQFDCPSKTALVFAKRKEKGVDGTSHIDGPAGYKKLVTIKPQNSLVNGWLRGEQRKYESTQSFAGFLKRNQASIVKGISLHNGKSRAQEEIFRKGRSKSLLNLHPGRVQESKQKINAMKDAIMKEREIPNLAINYKNTEMSQTTKFYSEVIPTLDVNGFIVKSGSFDQFLCDKKYQICLSNTQFVTNSSDAYQINKSSVAGESNSDQETLQKVNQISKFQELMQKAGDELLEERIEKRLNTAGTRSAHGTQVSWRSNSRSKKSASKVRNQKQKQIKEFESRVERVLRNQYLPSRHLAKPLPSLQTKVPLEI